MWNAFAGDEHRAFTLEGGRPGALLIHGFPGTPAEMRPLAHLLHDHGWTAHGVLLPGFGADIASLGARRWTEWFDAARDAFTTLARDHYPLIVIGNSMGGALALALAGEMQPDGVILFNPFWRIDHVLWQLLPVLKRAIPQFKPFSLIRLNFRDPEVRKGIGNFMPGANLDDPQVQAQIRQLAIPTGLFDQIRQTGQAAFRAAPRVTTPALVIQGSNDTLVKPTNTRQLTGRLGGQVTYVEVPAEHNVVMPGGAAWNQVQTQVLKFVGTLLQPARTGER